MIIEIDTNTTELNFNQLVQLEGREYLFSFQWLPREAAWYLSVADQDANPLALGIKLVVYAPPSTPPVRPFVPNLLRRFHDPVLPPGALLCVDMSGAGLDIQTPDELGKRVPLFYITSDSLS